MRGEDDILALQADLESLFSWQRDNNMSWNGKKFVAIRMGPNMDLIDSTVLLTPETDPIPEKEEARDLGIMMDRWGSFKPQRALVVSKVRAKASWVLRTFRTRTLWVSLIRPHQDYGSQLWAPVGSPGEIRAQEATLRAFLKRIDGFRELHYWDRLSLAGMYSTE